MRFYGEITRVDEEAREVSGYASTTQRASDGLVITREAMQGALDGYMAWANLREMHRKDSAVGVTRSAHVDENGMFITAHVVDDVAWEKVKTGVYKGFSIGAKVTRYNAVDRSQVDEMDLREISLVDRPADPGSKIDIWRSDQADEDDHLSLRIGLVLEAIGMGTQVLREAPALELTSAQAGQLQSLVDTAVARGWSPNLERLGGEALVQRLAEATTARDTLARRVDELNLEVTRLLAMPAPPKTVGSGARAVSKEEDAAGHVERGGGPVLSVADIQSALAAMDPDERALELIKASHRLPLRVSPQHLPHP